MSLADAPVPRAGGLLARIASPFAVGVVARIGGQAISFALVVVASRHLGLDAFGVYALAWAGAVIAVTFVYTGFYHAVLRSTDLARDIDTLFWAKTAVGVVGGCVLLALGFLAGGWNSEVGRALIIVAPLPLVAVPTAWNEAQLLREKRTRAASLYVLVSESVALAVAVAGLQAGLGVLALLLARHASALTAATMTTALVRRLPRLRFERDGMRDGASTVLPMWGTAAINMFSNYGADIVLAAFLNPAAVGAYRSGARIAVTAADIVFQPLRMLSWSRFARLEHEGDRPAIRGAWAENMGFACAMLWPVMAGVALLAEDLVATVFDPSWLPAAPVLAILCLSRSISVPQALAEPALMCVNRGALQFTLRALSGALLLAALLAIGRFGAEAAAWAMTATMLVMGIVTQTALTRVLGLTVPDLLRTYVPGLAVAAGCAASVLLLAPALEGLPTPLALLAHVVAGAAVWAIGIAALMRVGALRLPSP